MQVCSEISKNFVSKNISGEDKEIYDAYRSNQICFRSQNKSY
jgi:hypothetical protein